MTTANFTYLGKSGIKRNFFELQRLPAEQRQVEGLYLKLHLNDGFLSAIDDSETLFCEAWDRAFYQRLELKKTSDQLCSFDFFDAESNPKIRLYTANAGLIRKSVELRVPLIPDQPGEDEQGKNPANFFKPIPEDLGHEFWVVDWDEESDVKVYVNKKLKEIFGADLGANPEISALCMPFLVREVFLKIGLNCEGPIGLPKAASQWMSWANDLCSVSSTDLVPESFQQNKVVTDEYLSWVDDLVTNFCEKTRANGQTLMEDLLARGHKK